MPTIFPSTYSTLSAPALAVLITEKYGFGKVECRFMVRGVGDTYEVKSVDSRFILRIYRSTHRSYPEIEGEIELLLALKDAGVSVSYPIADAAGNCIQAIAAAEGIRHAVLFSYAHGIAVNILNEQQLCNLGYEMAKFHNVSSVISLTGKHRNFNLETTLFKPLQITEHAFAEYAEGFAWLLRAAKQVQHELSGINTSAFSTGYCHFDFLPKNFHFEGDNITLFDFDFFGYGWLVNDVMTFWQHLCLDVHVGRMTQQAADAAYDTFVNAYRKYRPLTEEELAAVPYLSLGFWVFYLGFYDTHDQFFPLLQPSPLKMRVTLIKQLMERYWK